VGTSAYEITTQREKSQICFNIKESDGNSKTLRRGWREYGKFSAENYARF